jgi:hypothetical protein
VKRDMSESEWTETEKVFAESNNSTQFQIEKKKDE